MHLSAPLSTAPRRAPLILDELLGETPRGEDNDLPLVSPGIPVGDGALPTLGNSLHATGEQARRAAATEAARLNAASLKTDPATGAPARYRFRVAHHAAKQPQDAPHYHVINEQGKQISGHFFYGRQPVRHQKKDRATVPDYDRRTHYPGANPDTSYSQYRTEWHQARAGKAEGRQRRRMQKGYELELETGAGPAAAPSSVIHVNIDVHAQYALRRMMSSADPVARADGASLLADVRAGKVRGIYQEDQYVPAMWAKERNWGWWQLLKPSNDAAVLLWANPATPTVFLPPIIIFGQSIRSNAARLDPALQWARQILDSVAALKVARPGLTAPQVWSALTGNPVPGNAAGLTWVILRAGTIG